MATVVASLCLPAVATAGTFTWSMPNDFTATGNGANPDNDRYGGHPWTYVEGPAGGLLGFSHDPSGFTPLPQFSTNVRGGLAGWSDPSDAAALVATNPGSSSVTSGGDTFDSGQLVLTPPVDRVVAVGWTSPLSHAATISISGAVHRAGASGCFSWSLDQNGRPLASSGLNLTGSFSATASVQPGDSVYLVVEPAVLGYSADCATALATLTVSEDETEGPSVTLDSPANGALVATSQPTFSGSASSGYGISPRITVRVYRGSTPSGTPVQTVSTTRQAPRSYGVKATSDLADGTYTVQAEQDDLATPPDTGLSAPVTFTVNTARPKLRLDGLGSAPLNTATPTLSGTGGVAAGDASTVVVAVYAGPDATGAVVRYMQASLRSGGRFSIAVNPPLPDGQYTAAAAQGATVGPALSNTVTFQVRTHPAGSAVGTSVTLDRHNVVTLRVSCFKPVLVASCTGNVLVVTAARLRPVSGGPTGHVRVLFVRVSIAPGGSVVIRRTLPGYVAQSLRRGGQVKLQVSADLSGSGGGATIRTLTRTR